MENIMKELPMPLKSGWKTCSVTVTKKTIAISTAIGELVGKKIDIYEYENVFAIVNNVNGEYMVYSLSPNSNRKLIHSRPLVRYIQEKYDCFSTMSLQAWQNGDKVLFCKGDAKTNQRFHSGFNLVSSIFRYRYENSIKIIGNKFIISAYLSKQLGKKLSIYEYGNFFALITDDNGFLQPKIRNEFGTTIIDTKIITEYVKEKLGTTFLYGTYFSQGIVFSKDRLINRKEFSINKFTAINYEHLPNILKPISIKPKTIRKQQKKKETQPYLSLREQGVIAVTKSVSLTFGPYISIYEFKNIVALVNDEYGKYYFYDRDYAFKAFTSNAISSYFKRKYSDPNLFRLNVFVRDGIIYASDRILSGKDLPDFSFFKKIYTSEHTKTPFEIRIYENRIYFPKRVEKYLADRISVYENEKYIAFVNNKGGTFNIHRFQKATEITSRFLSRYILSKYNFNKKCILDTRPIGAGLILAPKLEDLGNKEIKIKDLICVDNNINNNKY